MLHIRLSTALLLATSCVLWTAVSMEMVTTCDNGDYVQRLSCDVGVIAVQTALYGREDKVTCSAGKPPQQLANTECAQEGTVDALKTRCNGKKVCEINTNFVRTSDPCNGIFKYLQTKYTCFPANHVVACEGSSAHLYCDKGQVITVYGADYGRRDQTTCSYKRPEAQILNVDCSNPTNIVATRCNGKNSCTVEASNSVFTDPCGGTYKYLEVAYVCDSKTGSSETMLHIRLSTALLLATSCVLWTAVSMEMVTTCDDDDNVQRLSCDVGVISVQTALYGRADEVTCSEGKPPQQLANTECAQEGTVDALKTRCNGKKVCEINTNFVRTSDPCDGIFKYLQTKYTCFPANHVVACEGSTAHLYCDKGQVITVYGADYGRRDQTTCSYKRPESKILNVDCSNPTNIVATRCDGKNNCTVEASNSVFTEPCGGTYKYLEVAYVCDYPM
ncbi:rhamnose-binding lectin-like [Solea solea]|uniref:rhamnose-binding lectin-like n=1 Tax=Solea solea TaxID=90069 RepID=UPI00272A865E|nr:rhamnose-binding lectin-like [Solea solea]